MLHGLGIDNRGMADHFFAEMPAQVHECSEVDFAPIEKPAHLVLNIGQAEEPRPSLRPEFHKHIDVAMIGEAIGQHGAE